jgi:predicted restriction endonuclease
MYMWSTYASNFDNPIRFADPLGDMPDMDCCGGVYALPVGIGVGSGFAIGSTSAAALAPAAVVVVPVVLAVGVTVYAVRNPESLVGIGNSNVPLNAQAATARYHQQNAWQSPKFMSGLGGTTQKLGATLKAQGEKQVAAQKTQGSTKPVQQGSQRQFNLPKPPKGRGSVPPDQRDPKRIYSKKERSDMLDKQNGVCVGCGQQKTVNQVDGHHIIRHADGGKTNVENGAALCKNCHTQIHQ